MHPVTIYTATLDTDYWSLKPFYLNLFNHRPHISDMFVGFNTFYLCL